MSLIWHIVRKDLRRLRLPLALWLALILTQTVLLTRVAGLVDAPPFQFQAVNYFAGTWGVIVLAIGFILAAWLVMEDSLVDTRAFWPTRPISGARLLAAKTLGAVGMFGVVPLLVLTPVWLACGFSGGEWAGAALDWFLSQTLWSMAAFTIAAVTGTAGQFLVRAVGLSIGLPLLLLLASGRISLWPNLVVQMEFSGGIGLESTRYVLALGLTIVCGAALVLHQFLTRRTARSALVAGLWLVLLIGVRNTSGWDFTTFPDRARRTDGPLRFSATITATGKMSNGREEIRLDGRVTGEAAGSYIVPQWARGQWVWAGGRAAERPWLRRAAGSTPPPPAAVVLHVAGMAADPPEPAMWTLTGREDPDVLRNAEMSAELTLGVDVMHGRVQGQLPLREGAVLQVGASRTRIEKLEPRDGKIGVRLRLQDAGKGAAEDAYVLFSPSRKQGWLLDAQDLGTVLINSIRVGERQLVVDPPASDPGKQRETGPDGKDDLVILKVRFEPERVFAGPLKASVIARH